MIKEVDKIKLFTTNTNSIAKQVIDNNFEYVGTTYDVLKHNTRNTFKNVNTNIAIDKFGIVVKTNPTNYIKDNNIIQIDRKELITFKELFETDLSINTNNFMLTGCDFNINVLTDYEPKAYFSSIGTLPKYKLEKYPYTDAIIFTNNCKAFRLYDKIRQYRHDNEYIPREYTNSNILRLEMAIKGKMAQTKNLATIKTLQDITQANNYILAITEFQNIYNKIHKQPTVKFKDMKLPNPNTMNVTDFALLFYLNDIGIDVYFTQLQQERDMNIISYRQMKLRKDKAIELWQLYSGQNQGDTIDLLDEMDTKVNNTIYQLKELAA